MQEKSTVVNVWGMLLDILFPRHCLGCSALLASDSAHRYVCVKCFVRIEHVPSIRCAFCQNGTPNGETCRFCRSDHALDRLFVVADYGDPFIVRIVKALKYRFAREVAKDMGASMITYLKPRLAKLRIDHTAIIVIPIPLHPSRKRWRGFNQAELLAECISDGLDLQMRTNVLVRTKSTKPQADIEDRLARIKNSESLFALAVAPLNSEPAVRPLSGKTVLLVDDVSTTGGTLDSATRVLKDAGATTVIGFVFARG